MSGHSLLMPFDSDDEAFSRGFEAGRVYALLEAESQIDDEWDLEPLTVHASNTEMMLRIAERFGCSVQSEDLDETWITVTFGAPA